MFNIETIVKRKMCKLQVKTKIIVSDKFISFDDY